MDLRRSELLDLRSSADEDEELGSVIVELISHRSGSDGVPPGTQEVDRSSP